MRNYDRYFKIGTINPITNHENRRKKNKGTNQRITQYKFQVETKLYNKEPSLPKTSDEPNCNSHKQTRITRV